MQRIIFQPTTPQRPRKCTNQPSTKASPSLTKIRTPARPTPRSKCNTPASRLLPASTRTRATPKSVSIGTPPAQYSVAHAHLAHFFPTPTRAGPGPSRSLQYLRGDMPTSLSASDCGHDEVDSPTVLQFRGHSEAVVQGPQSIRRERWEAYQRFGKDAVLPEADDWGLPAEGEGFVQEKQGGTIPYAEGWSERMSVARGRKGAANAIQEDDGMVGMAEEEGDRRGYDLSRVTVQGGDDYDHSTGNDEESEPVVADNGDDDEMTVRVGLESQSETLVAYSSASQAMSIANPVTDHYKTLKIQPVGSPPPTRQGDETSDIVSVAYSRRRGQSARLPDTVRALIGQEESTWDGSSYGSEHPDGNDQASAAGSSIASVAYAARQPAVATMPPDVAALIRKISAERSAGTRRNNRMTSGPRRVAVNTVQSVGRVVEGGEEQDEFF